MNVATADAVKRIADASHGQIEVKVFGNSIFGGDQQMLQQLRSGALELMQVGNNVLGGVIPAANLLSVPFAFKSPQQYQSAANGPLGAYIGAAGAAAGIRKFESGFYGGFFEVQNRVRPINVPGRPQRPEDPRAGGAARRRHVQGARRVADGDQPVRSLHSLQTHLVDGIEVPLPTVRNFKFYEQVKYCSLTHHSGLTYMLFVNADAWNSLPKNLQEILDRELDAAAVAASRSMAAQEASIETELTADGMTFNRPALEPFSQAIRASGLYGQLRDQYDPKGWDVLEKTTGKLV